METKRPRLGLDVVILFLALHFAIGSRLTTWEYRSALNPGDPQALWGGLGFLLWGERFSWRTASRTDRPCSGSLPAAVAHG